MLILLNTHISFNNWLLAVQKKQQNNKKIIFLEEINWPNDVIMPLLLMYATLFSLIGALGWIIYDVKYGWAINWDNVFVFLKLAFIFKCCFCKLCNRIRDRPKIKVKLFFVGVQ